MNLDPSPVTENTFLASVAGAIVSGAAFPGATAKEKATNFVYGLLIAVFVGPALCDHWSITSLRLSSAISFVLAMAGLVAVRSFLDGVKSTPFGQILTSWLSRNRGAQ